MTRYPIPITNNTSPTAAKIIPKKWAATYEDDDCDGEAVVVLVLVVLVVVMLTGLTKKKDPNATRVTPENSNNIPAIIVTPCRPMLLALHDSRWCMISNHMYIYAIWYMVLKFIF